ncbi:uncharacterized protein LOC136718065 [Amia ocellicauda]|uniref:uncharacterized protein LOC136718065 n=1 Tax=Amia ocellicauda TaxID=2972642 RepID=UPI0034640F69
MLWTASIGLLAVLALLPSNAAEIPVQGEPDRLKGKSLYDELWDNNKDIADKTLETDFLKKMAAGTLPAERYTNLTIQDVYYAVEVTKILNRLQKEKDSRDDVKHFLIDRYSSYNQFAQFMLQQYNLKNSVGIKPSPATASYLKSYGKFAMLDHIYFAVALLPCARLWPYLAEHLDIPKDSPYYRFKADNEGGNTEKHYKNLLEKYRRDIKESYANFIFRQQMIHENEFFKSA